MKKSKRYDILGIVSSTLCLLHCLLLPVVLIWHSAYPEALWHLLDYVFIMLAGMAVYYSAGNSASGVLKYAFWVSFSFFAIGLIFHEQLAYATLLSFLGSVALVVCHLANLKAHMHRHHSFVKVK